MLMCPHCGWQYDPAAFVGKPGVPRSPYALVPPHDMVGRTNDDPDPGTCMGEEQHPRNPETDRRPLWKDGGVTRPWPT